MIIPRIGMGTWGMGGKYEQDPTNTKESIDVLRYGLDLGFRLIDTAELYGEGLTETIVGEAIKGYDRKDIFIISKVWKTHMHYSDVLQAAEASLKRLGTDYLDLYLVHWPNEDVPLAETMRAMEYLVDNGYVHNIGVSNFSQSLLVEAQSYLDHTLLAADEAEYNLVEHSAERDIIPFCRDNDIVFIAHRPLAKGKLVAEQRAALFDLAKKYNKTPAQVALNWIISQGIVAIPKAGSIEHLKENFGALGWHLDERDVGLLGETYKNMSI